MEKRKGGSLQKFSQRKSGRLLVSSVVVLLVLSLFAWYVLADPSHTVGDATITAANLTFTRSGFAHSVINMLNPSVVGQVRILNISGTISNFSLFLSKPGVINERISNISVMWQLRSNNSFMRNDTLSNVSGTTSCPGTMNCNNMTSFNTSFNSVGSLPDGVYNLTVFIYNWTEGTSSINVTNVTFITNVTVDNTVPRVANLSINTTNGTNYTRVGFLSVGVTVNDTTTWLKSNPTMELINLLNNSRANFTTNLLSITTWNITLDFSTLGDGKYIIRVHANDSVDNMNTTTDNVSFTVDSGTPNVTATSADGLQDRNFTTTVTVELVFNASVNDSVTSLKGSPLFDFKTNGTAFNRSASITEGRWNLSNLNATLFTQGRHTVTILANDSLDNQNRSQTIDFRVDGTVPQLSNLSMNFTNGTNFTNSGVIKLNVTANDSITTPNSVTFEIVGLRNNTRFNATVLTVSGSADGPQGANWATDLVLSTFQDGVFDVRVYAADTVGNVNQTISMQNITFTVDGTAPTVVAHGFNVSNSSGNFTNAGFLAINASVNDTTTSVAKGVIIEITNLWNGSVLNTTVASPEYRETGYFNSFRLNISLAERADGRYRVRLHANDSLGNRLSPLENISFIVDSAAPTVVAYGMNVTNNSVGRNYTNVGFIAINASVNDTTTSVAKGVILEFTNLQNGSVTNTSVRGPDLITTGYFDSFRLNLSFAEKADGKYTVRLHANDSLGNRLTPLENISFTVDGTAPTIIAFGMNVTNNSAGRNYTNAGFLAFNASVNDTTTAVAFGVTFEVTNLQNGTIFNTTVGSPEYTVSSTYNSWRLNISLAERADGRYNVRMHANDSVGNRVIADNVSFTIDSTAPRLVILGMNVSNVSQGLNFSDSAVVLALNASLNDTTTTVAKNVTLEFTNLHNTTVVNRTIAGPELRVSRYYESWRLSLDLSPFGDGRYTVRVHANDSLGNRLTPVENISFTVDRTPPNVTGQDLNNFTNAVNFSASYSDTVLILNATVNDSITAIVNVTFSVTNGTNSTHGPINYSGQAFNGVWNVTINLTNLNEGNHNITVVAIDSLRNRNASLLNASGERLTFTLDRTAPVISVTCTPSTAKAGETVTCDCSASERTTGLLYLAQFTSGKATESTTATGSGGFDSSTCSATDFAGNAGSKKGSWTVTATTGGGAGAGGAGGGAASGVVGSYEQKTWTSINPGEKATVGVRNGLIGVTEVSFQVTEVAYGGWLKVEKESALPSNVGKFSGKTYSVIEISKGTALKDEKITKGEIKFKVEKKWLEDNKLGKERVALHRYTDGKWTQLPTTVGEDDGTHVHYTAETPGFSLFVIGEKTKAAEVAAAAPEEAPVEEAPAAAPEAAPVAAPTEAEVAPEAAGVSALPIVALVIVLVAVVLVLLGLKKKKKR